MADGDDRKAALVAIMIFEGNQDRTTIGGTAVSWSVHDMTIVRNLQDQLMALLGEPLSETLLPPMPADQVKHLPSTWPGTVHVNRDDPEP